MDIHQFANRSLLVLGTGVLAACGGGSSGAPPIGGQPAPPPSEPGVISFSADSFTVDESATSVSIVVQRTGGNDGAVTATMTVADGTAVDGIDYTGLSQSVAFADGDTSDKTVVVNLIDDDIDEPDETIQLSLSGATGGVSLGTPINAVVVIVDDEPDEFTVGLTVSGLNGEGLILRNNGGDDLAVGSDGTHSFTGVLFDGDGYEASVSVQPWRPAQTCAITNANGTIAGANADDVQVTCENADLQTLLVYRAGPVGAEDMTDLVLVREDGESLVELTSTPDKREIGYVVHKDRVVFSRQDPQSGEQNLFSVRRDGTGTILLNKQPSPEFVGITARDIAIYNSEGNVYSVNMTNGLEHTPVLVSAETDRAMDVSIDGTIVVQREAAGHGDLYATDTFGSQLIPLATSLSEERLVTVTRTGRVVYEYYEPGTAPGSSNPRDIHSVSVAGGGMVPISLTPLSDERILDWDGPTGVLIMERRDLRGDKTLFAATADDRAPKQLSQAQEYVSFESFAPGERIIYEVERSSGDLDVMIVNFDGTGHVVLAPSDDSEEFAGFSTDGAAIIHRTTDGQGDLYRVELDNSGEMPLASTIDDEQLIAADPDPARGRLAISREPFGLPAQMISVAPDGADERLLVERHDRLDEVLITRYGSLLYLDEESRLSRVSIDGSAPMLVTPFAEPTAVLVILED
jgi:hypothetical protein